MIIYPYGGEYKRARAYVPSEEGAIGLSWMIPVVVLPLAVLLVVGFTLGALCMILGGVLHAVLLLGVLHPRFHVANHPWLKSWYFRLLDDIHLLHHWDQRFNYTIVFPGMDILFGTYLAPRKHRAEIAQCLGSSGLTVSDAQNWFYLLEEARPEVYAVMISAARTHRPSRRILTGLTRMLEIRVESHPEDARADQLLRRAREFAVQMDKDKA
jgi:hypothetical protein